MSRVVELAVPHNVDELLLKGEIKPDFRIFTAAAEAEKERPVVHMIGSSTERDLQGDTMTVNALADMCKIAPMLSVFMNHEYDLPDKLFGSIIEPPMLIQQDGIADLHLTVGVEMDNPPAVKTLQFIRNGRRLGCSVGCMVTKYEIADEEEDGDNWFFMPLIIQGVYVVEFSVVSIPANQRSWVDNALKGAFARTLDYHLAPAMKSLWPDDFSRIVKSVNDAHLRDLLLAQPERPGGDIHLDWKPNTKTFVFSSHGKKKTLEVPEVSALLQKHQGHVPAQKAVSGNTGLPLMDIGTEWTGSKAEKEIFSQAEDGDGTIQASKAKPGFLWYDPDNADKRGGYKMPFCYVSGGMKIVPLGVRACANVLAGGRGGGNFGGDEGAMKSKCKTMYGRINSQFKPDPEWVVPWEKEDSQEPETVLMFDHVTINGVTYAFDEENNAFVPWVSEQEESDMKKELEIKSDGSHEKYTGTHTHNHKAFGSQGDDQTHEHEHSHDDDAEHDHAHAKSAAHLDIKALTINPDGTHAPTDGSHSHGHKAYGASDGNADGMHEHSHDHSNDANHGHSHANAGKSIEPQHALNADGSQGILLKDTDGNHDPFDGTHTHSHKAFNGPDNNDDGMHQHSHQHSNDSNHQHSHDGVSDGDGKSGEPEHTHNLDPIQALLLSHYNNMGKSLGLPEVTAEHVVHGAHPALNKDVDMQNVVTCVSAIDQLSDALEAKVDYLMVELGIPDYDPPTGAEPTAYQYALATRFVKRAFELVHKEGREFSSENMGTIQQIHDMLNDMTGGMVCGARGNSNSQGDGMNTSEAAQDANAAMGRREIQDSLVELFSKSLISYSGSVDAFSKLVEGIESFKSFEREAQKAQTMLAMIKRDTGKMFEEAKQATDTIRKLKALPLGRPTNFTRTVEASASPANTVSYAQLASIEEGIQKNLDGPQSAEEALALTRIVEETLRNGQTLKFREWPPEARNRPELTGFQRQLMSGSEMVAYSKGELTRVPLSPLELPQKSEQSA